MFMLNFPYLGIFVRLAFALGLNCVLFLICPSSLRLSRSSSLRKVFSKVLASLGPSEHTRLFLTGTDGLA